MNRTTAPALCALVLLTACLARAGDPLSRADAAFAAGRAEEAQGLYEALVAQGTPVAHVYRNLAVLYDEARRGGADTAKAEELYRRALALAPGDAGAHFRLGLHLHADGRGREAVSALRQAVAIDRRHAGAHYWLARLLDSYGEGGFPEREALYRAAIAADPGYADAYFFLGRALLAAGRREDALRVLRQGRAQPARRGHKQPSHFDDEIESLNE